MSEDLRLGQAAALLGVSVDTVRRWVDDGRIEGGRTPGGHRTVSPDEVRRVLAERPHYRPSPTSSARNQLHAVVKRVVADGVAATVEMQAGPYRLLALTTAESVTDLGLAEGVEVVASVKATNVVVSLPLP